MRPGSAAALLPCVVLIATAAGAVGAAASAAPAGADNAAPYLRLDVRLATSEHLSPVARASLIREVDGIWRREGVRVQWQVGSVGVERPAYALRVLVVQRESPTNNTRHKWPVGELLRDQADNSVAVVSIDAAARVLAVAARSDEPTALLERRLGMVLGRAVAHEIGHYLLDTPGHSRQGLMRAHIDAHDFVDLRTGAFFLDDTAGRWIRERLSQGASTEPRLARFAYAR